MGNMEYNRKNTVTILLRFNKKTDPDIIERFQNVGNKVAYVKRLIRADIAKNCPDIDTYIDADEGINPEE